MKKIIIPLWILLLIIPLTAFSSDLEKYFKDFEKAATKKDQKALKELIYPLKLTGEDIQKEIINSILADNEASSGDGAFSLRALNELTNSHLDKFYPVPEVLYEELMRNEEMASVLKKINKKNIMIFDNIGVKIILVKDKKGWQLLFWENLNNLIH